MIFVRNSVLITGALNGNGLASSVEQFASRSGRRNLQLKRLRDLLSLGETHRARMHSDTKKPRGRVKVVLLSSFINIGFFSLPEDTKRPPAPPSRDLPIASRRSNLRLTHDYVILTQSRERYFIIWRRRDTRKCKTLYPWSTYRSVSK